MSRFKQPSLLPIPWKGKWAYMLAEDWEVDVFGVHFLIPGGVVTDGASIPRAFWTILGLNQDGLHRGAATLHDCLFALCGVFCGAIWDRQTCNLAYHDLCLRAGMSRHSASVMLLGLKLGSWVPWNRYARQPSRHLTMYEVS